MLKQKLYAGLIGGMLMLGLTLSNPAMAGKDLTGAEVPPAALKAFQAMYPNAQKVEWKQKKKNIGELKGQTVYEVEFENEYGLDLEDRFTADGKLVKEKMD